MKETDNKRTPRLYYDEHKNKFYFIIKNEKVYIPLHNTKQEGTNNFKQIGKTIINILHNKNAHFKVKSRRRKKPIIKRIITSHQITTNQIPSFIQSIPNYTQMQPLGSKIGFYEPIQSIPPITKEQEVQEIKKKVEEIKQQEKKVEKEIIDLEKEIKQEEDKIPETINLYEKKIPETINLYEKKIPETINLYEDKIPISSFTPNLNDILKEKIGRLEKIIKEKNKQTANIDKLEKIIKIQDKQLQKYLPQLEQQPEQQPVKERIKQIEEKQQEKQQEQQPEQQPIKKRGPYKKTIERQLMQKEEQLQREQERLQREQQQQQKKTKIKFTVVTKKGYIPTAPLDNKFLVDELQKNLDKNQKQTKPIETQPVESQPVETQPVEAQPLPFVPEQPLNTVGGSLIERVSNWFKGVHKLPHSVTSILNHYGNAEVTGITIGRKPLNSIILKFANAISSQPYDKLFHLYAIIKTSQGSFTLEKESTIRLIKGERYSHGEGFEYLNVDNVPSGLTLSQMLENTEKRMGQTKFIQYSAYSSNCQDFLYNVMKANGINDNTILSFIKQDTKSIFENNPTIRKLVNTVTDTHAVVYGTGYYEGDGKYEGFTDGLYDDEIQEIMKDEFNKFCPVIMSDQISSLLKYVDYHTKQFGFIINTENSHEKGQHWIGVFIDVPLGEVCIYNSLADPPTKSQIKGIKELVTKINPPYLMKLKYNHIKVQNDYSNNCGFFALRFIEQMYNGIPVNLGSQTGGVKDASINGEKSIEKFKDEL